MDINRIKQDGFILKEVRNNNTDVALISLRLALKAYFSTYKSIARHVNPLVDKELTQEEKDKLHTIPYVENACEAIVHFHHFVELVIKEILRTEHPLLAADASNDHGLLYDLLNRREADETAMSKTKSLEFRQSLERIIALIKRGDLGPQFEFFIEHKNFLEELNQLRNRIAHRGVYVLRYIALDMLFGKYALPLTKKIIALPQYEKQRSWLYKPLHADIDPIDEIIDCCKKKYYLKKVAVLKELGRAAYENPLIFSKITKPFRHFDRDAITRSEHLAKHILSSEFQEDVKNCPVCGVDSLVRFPDYVDIEDKDGITTEYYQYIYMVKCFCCSFELNSEVAEFEKMKLPIENFWKIE